jgi:hypothetical protein
MLGNVCLWHLGDVTTDLSGHSEVPRQRPLMTDTVDKVGDAVFRL